MSYNGTGNYNSKDAVNNKGKESSNDPCNKIVKKHKEVFRDSNYPPKPVDNENNKVIDLKGSECKKGIIDQQEIGNVAGVSDQKLDKNKRPKKHQDAIWNLAKCNIPLSEEDRTVDFTGLSYQQTFDVKTSILQTKMDAANLGKHYQLEFREYEHGMKPEDFDPCYTIVKCKVGDVECKFRLAMNYSTVGMHDSNDDQLYYSMGMPQTGNSLLFFDTSGGDRISFSYDGLYDMIVSESERLLALDKIKTMLQSLSHPKDLKDPNIQVNALRNTVADFHSKEESFCNKVKAFYLEKGIISLKHPEEKFPKEMVSLYKRTDSRYIEKSYYEVLTFCEIVKDLNNKVKDLSQTKEPKLVEFLKDQVESLYAQVKSRYEEKLLYLRFIYCLEAPRRFVVDDMKDPGKRRDIFHDLPIEPAVALTLALVNGDFQGVKCNETWYTLIHNCYSMDPQYPGDTKKDKLYYEYQKKFRKESICKLVDKCSQFLPEESPRWEKLADDVLERQISDLPKNYEFFAPFRGVFFSNSCYQS